MVKLVYSAIESLDGYIADEAGEFDWAQPDETVHTFINDLERPVGMYLLGRRMYEVMAVWETMGLDAHDPAFIVDYANMWRAADKVVYSTTLEEVSGPRTRIEREFDPAVVARMKQELDGDISVGGADLAAQAIAAGLVDEYQLFVVPIVIGAGTRSLPDGVRISLELQDTHRFSNGFVYLNYRAI